MASGQALVEFALVLPVLLFLLLGFGEVALLVADRFGFANGVTVVAAASAEEAYETPGWRARFNAVQRDELARVGCDLTNATLVLPDGTTNPGDRIVVAWDCRYHFRLMDLWDGFNVHVESSAVVPGASQPTSSSGTPPPASPSPS